MFSLEKYVFLNRERTCFHVLSLFVSLLFYNLGYDPGGDGAAAFSDGEAQAFVHGDGGDEFDFEGGVVAGHDHFDTVC